jgi:hypothetical protein
VGVGSSKLLGGRPGRKKPRQGRSDALWLWQGGFEGRCGLARVGADPPGRRPLSPHLELLAGGGAGIGLEVVGAARLWEKAPSPTFPFLPMLIVMSSGQIRPLSLPILGCAPRPRNRPGGSTRKFPTFSLRPSMMA